MFDYYYRGTNEDEVVIQVVNNKVCIRVTEDDGLTTALVELGVEEIDRMIRGLQAAKQKIR